MICSTMLQKQAYQSRLLKRSRGQWVSWINGIKVLTDVSRDANLAHCSYEAGILEDPNQTPPNDMWTMTDDPLKAPNEPTDITISFQKGIPAKLVTPQKTFTDSVQLFKELNRIGKVHGT